MKHLFGFGDKAVTMRMGCIVLTVCVLSFAFPCHLLGIEEYAERTGRSCQACHIDPSGGEELTREGEAFREDLRKKGLYEPLTTGQRIARLIIGYLHMITAFVWFGTILYVHIFLKPAYAARGLPRRELRLGQISIIVVAVTGTFLTITRVSSWNMLFHTRFGILLTIKIGLFLLMVASAVFVTFVIGPRLRRGLKIQQGKRDVTIEELAAFDGKEGRPAYIAYNGVVYDVSDSTMWSDGTHVGRHFAGLDLTDVLGQAPHEEDKIISMPHIGTLLESTEKVSKSLHEKVFYFFAYMNLILVFVIIFVISLWRW